MNADDGLRQLFEAADRALPGERLDWNDTITRARRSRLVRLVAAGAVAAALALGAAVGVATLGRDRAPEPIPPVGPTPSETPTPSPSPSPSPTESLPSESDVNSEDVFPSVDRFFAAAGQGDAAGMWEEMSGPARRAFDDDVTALEEFIPQGVSEGLGSWDAAVGRGVQFELLGSTDDGGFGVATVFGERAPEGNVEPYAILPLPIRIDSAGDATLEWLGEAPPEADFVVPEDRTPFDVSAVSSIRPTFEALVDEGPTEVYMVTAAVASEPPGAREVGVPQVEDVGDGRIRAVWRPEGRLFSAEWFLTIVLLGDDGVLRADATRFIVE